MSAGEILTLSIHDDQSSSVQSWILPCWDDESCCPSAEPPTTFASVLSLDWKVPSASSVDDEEPAEPPKPTPKIENPTSAATSLAEYVLS